MFLLAVIGAFAAIVIPAATASNGATTTPFKATYSYGPGITATLLGLAHRQDWPERHHQGFGDVRGLADGVLLCSGHLRDTQLLDERLRQCIRDERMLWLRPDRYDGHHHRHRQRGTAATLGTSSPTTPLLRDQSAAAPLLYSGVDLLLAPPSPEAADLVTAGHLHQILELLSGMYDYVIVDIDKRLEDRNLMVLDVADTIFAVMTADLSCLKNVRLLLETIGHLGDEQGNSSCPEPVERLHGHQRQERRGRRRRPDRDQVVSHRVAILALNTGRRSSCPRRTRCSGGRSLTSRRRSTRARRKASGCWPRPRGSSSRVPARVPRGARPISLR